MSSDPSTVPRAAPAGLGQAPPADAAEPGLHATIARLRALREPAQWQAAALALMLAPESRRKRAVWFDESRGLPDAGRVLDDVRALPQAYRLPWFETLARQLAPGPVEPRHRLIGAARRLMSADGVVSPMDQLRWVALRHLLAGSAVAAPAAASTELAEIDDASALKVCLFSAFLSQVVPLPELTLDLSGKEPANLAWFERVVEPWRERFALPPRERHDIDATLRALRVLQAMPWMLRPVLVRHWFGAAQALSDGPVLHPVAADALRLSCGLLDSPVPPDLRSQYIEVEPERL